MRYGLDPHKDARYGGQHFSIMSNIRWSRLAHSEIPDRRLNDTSFCRCENCQVLPYNAMAREMVCCRDELLSNNRWSRNLRKIMEGHRLKCITNYEDVQTLCTNKTVKHLFLLLLTRSILRFMVEVFHLTHHKTVMPVPLTATIFRSTMK